MELSAGRTAAQVFDQLLFLEPHPDCPAVIFPLLAKTFGYPFVVYQSHSDKLMLIEPGRLESNRAYHIAILGPTDYYALYSRQQRSRTHSVTFNPRPPEVCVYAASQDARLEKSAPLLEPQTADEGTDDVSRTEMVWRSSSNGSKKGDSSGASSGSGFLSLHQDHPNAGQRTTQQTRDQTRPELFSTSEHMLGYGSFCTSTYSSTRRLHFPSQTPPSQRSIRSTAAYTEHEYAARESNSRDSSMAVEIEQTNSDSGEQLRTRRRGHRDSDDTDVTKRLRRDSGDYL